MSGRRRALIVATQTYADPALTRLQAPDADAAALAEVLADPAIGDFEVSTVLDGRSHEVTMAVAELFSDGRPDDLLLLHFSCHGLKDDSGELYFAATDTRLDLLDATAVASSFVNRVMDRSRAGRVLLLLDCCYAGAFARGLSARAAGPVDVNERLGGRGRAVITASSALQFAFEGQRLAEGEAVAPSVFTHALVDGLRSGEADRDLDGWVSLDELYAYVHDAVTRANPDQTPKKWAFDIAGDLYVAHRARPVTTPSELPDQIRRTIGSLMTWERASAVQPLRDLMDGDHPGLALAARLALQRMSTHDDSVQVRRAAGVALAGAPADPAPPLPRTSEPVVEPVVEPGARAEDGRYGGPDGATVPGPRLAPASTGASESSVRDRAPAADPPVAVPPVRPGPDAGDGDPPGGRRRRRTRLVVGGVLTALVLVVAAGWLWWPHHGAKPPPPPPRLVTALPDSEILLTQSNGGPDEIVAYDVIADGGSTRAVVQDPSATLPTISPDRQQMVYLAGTSAAGQVPYLARVDGQAAHRLLRGKVSTVCPVSGRPAWDPRGTRLALVCAVAGGQRLVVVDADGSHPITLAAVRPVGAPTWLDANTVVYESAGATAGASHTLRSVRLVGGATAELTDGSHGSDTQPDVTRGGLVFLRKATPSSPTGDVWFRSTSGRERRLTTEDDADWPAPSPDGTTMVWLQGAAGTQVVVRRALAGGTPTTLHIAGVPGAPAWDSR